MAQSRVVDAAAAAAAASADVDERISKSLSALEICCHGRFRRPCFFFCLFPTYFTYLFVSVTDQPQLGG